MFVTIVKVNNKEFDREKEIKKVREENGESLYIPTCFKDEEQYDRWFDEVFKKYRAFHLRKNNKNEIMEFEGIQLELKFS